MRTFVLEKPETLDEAVQILKAGAGTARPVAGGTAFFALWKQRIISPKVVVDLSGIEDLRRISVTDSVIEIGALTSLAELEDSDLVRSKLPLLHSACCQTANRRIREMATLGGSVAHGETASDVNAGSLASDMVVHLVGSSGKRSVPISEFFKGFYETDASPDEVVTSITCPVFTERHRYAYLKYSPRSHYDKPTLGVAVSWVDDGGACHDVRVGFSNLATTPVRCPAAEAVLEGTMLTDDVLAKAAQAAFDSLEPMSDMKASSEYKREMAGVFLRRAIKQAVSV